MCQCKCFEEAKKLHFDLGKHSFVKTDFSCPMCKHSKNRFGMHKNETEYDVIVLECSKCHSYIKYLELDNSLFKEEFYYDNLLIILGQTESLILQDGKSRISLPKFKFTDKDSFLNKIKTYLVFQ